MKLICKNKNYPKFLLKSSIIQSIEKEFKFSTQNMFVQKRKDYLISGLQILRCVIKIKTNLNLS